MFLRRHGDGEVRLLGAKLGGASTATARRSGRRRMRRESGVRCRRRAGGGGRVPARRQGDGEVRLLGAKLGGNLACNGATFRAEKDADGQSGGCAVGRRAGGGGRRVPARRRRRPGRCGCSGRSWAGTSTAPVRRSGRRRMRRAIRGMRCRRRAGGRRRVPDGVTATGAVRLLGRSWAGPDCTVRRSGRRRMRREIRGCAVGRRAKVEGVFLAGRSQCRGRAQPSAEFGAINDSAACWPGQGDLVLDRCQYGAFTGGPVDAEARLDWLGRQEPARLGVEFWPQPYEQCAKVLREMGHGEDAREILIEKERLQRAARNVGAGAAGKPECAGIHAGWDRVLRQWTVRYRAATCC